MDAGIRLTALACLGGLLAGCNVDVWSIGGLPHYEAALRARIQARNDARAKGLDLPPLDPDEVERSVRLAEAHAAAREFSPPPRPLMSTAVQDAASRCGMSVESYLALKSWTPRPDPPRPPGVVFAAHQAPLTIPNPMVYPVYPLISRPNYSAGIIYSVSGCGSEKCKCRGHGHSSDRHGPRHGGSRRR